MVVDQLTKQSHFFAHNDTCTATDVAEIFYNHVFKLHRLPRQIISDRGTQFASKVFQEFCKKLDIKLSMSTAYHPQTDGQTKRVNQTLEQYLRVFCNHRQDDWAKLLTTAEFTYNNIANESTLLSPFFVEYRYHPRMAPNVKGELTAPSLDNIFANRAEAREMAMSSLTLAAERFKWYADRKNQEAPFKIGNLVMLKGQDLRIRHTTKLAAKNYGPYEIINQPGPVNYKLKLPHSVKIHPVFHASKLILYHKDTIRNQNPSKPDPIQVEGQDKFIVEKIINSRLFRRRVQYLVKWEGYSESENTWEPVQHLMHCWELVEKFHLENPTAVKAKSSLDSMLQ